MLQTVEYLTALPQASPHPRSGSKFAGALLLAKGIKTCRATVTLVEQSFGEDAMIVARSLVNLCINVAYIAESDSEERTRDWRAAGDVSMLKVGTAAGVQMPPLDDATKTRAKRWSRGGAIKARATVTGHDALYDLAYQHGSSYEHSDAWSAEDFASDNEAARESVLFFSLLIAARSLIGVVVASCRLLDLDWVQAKEQIERAYFEGFPTT